MLKKYVKLSCFILFAIVIIFAVSPAQAFELQWAWVSAGIVLSLLPVIVIILVFQKWVIRGLTAGSLKY